MAPGLELNKDIRNSWQSKRKGIPPRGNRDLITLLFLKPDESSSFFLI